MVPRNPQDSIAPGCVRTSCHPDRPRQMSIVARHSQLHLAPWLTVLAWSIMHCPSSPNSLHKRAPIACSRRARLWMRRALQSVVGPTSAVDPGYHQQQAPHASNVAVDTIQRRSYPRPYAESCLDTSPHIRAAHEQSVDLSSMFVVLLPVSISIEDLKQ